MQFRNPANHALVRKALRLAGREDLIGRGRECLVPPEREAMHEVRPSTGRGKKQDDRRHSGSQQAQTRDNPAHDRKAVRHPDKQSAARPPRHGGRPEGSGSRGRSGKRR